MFMHLNVPYMNSENGVLLKSNKTFSSRNLFFVSGRLLMILMSVTFFGNKAYFKILFGFFFFFLESLKILVKILSFNASAISLLKVTSSMSATYGI